MPPLHPFCRSTTVPYFGNKEGTRVARGEDGKTYPVPADMTYDQWYKEYVQKYTQNKIYEDAKRDGKHSGKYKDACTWDDKQVLKAYNSYIKQVKEHDNKIKNPRESIKDWDNLDPRYKKGLLAKWAKDKKRNQELSYIMKGILKERGIDLDD